MILWSLRCFELLIVLLSCCSYSNAFCWIKVIKYAKRCLLLLLLENNLWNWYSASSYPLDSRETRNRTSLIHHFNVFVKDTFKLVSDVLIVRLVLVLQTCNVIENVLNFLYIFCHNPQFWFGIIQTFGLYVLNFIHGVFFLFSPLEFLIKEVENNKVQAPNIISSWKVLYIEINEYLTNNFKLRYYYEH